MISQQKDKGAPEPGKQYMLMGAPGQKSIAHGNTWAESEVPFSATKADLDRVNSAIKKKYRYVCGIDRPWTDRKDGASETFFVSPDGQNMDLMLGLQQLGYAEIFYNAPYHWRFGKNGVYVEYVEGDLYITNIERV